ncbi:MAG: MoaD/ThiS family protein [Cyanobacteriota bacterium]
MKTAVVLRYFASLAEEAQMTAESLETDCRTYRELYACLARRHGFTLPAEAVKVAVNDEFTDLDSAVIPGGVIVFIPPVAGG